MSSIGAQNTSRFGPDLSNAFEDSIYSQNPIKPSEIIQNIIEQLNNSISFENRSLTKEAVDDALIDACKDNWDEEGGKKVSTETHDLAKKIVDSLPPNITAPCVMPMKNGKIGFEWRSKYKRIAVITIGDDKKLIFTSNVQGKRTIVTDEFKGGAIPEVDQQLTKYFKE